MAINLYAKPGATGTTCEEGDPCDLSAAVGVINNSDNTTDEFIIMVEADEEETPFEVESSLIVKKSFILINTNEEKKQPIRPCVSTGNDRFLFAPGEHNVKIGLQGIAYRKAAEDCYLFDNHLSMDNFQLSLVSFQNIDGIPFIAPFIRTTDVSIRGSEFGSLSSTLKFGSNRQVIFDDRKVSIESTYFHDGYGVQFNNFQKADIVGSRFERMSDTALSSNGVSTQIRQSTFLDITGKKYGGAVAFTQTPVFPNVALSMTSNNVSSTSTIYGGCVYIRITSIFPSWYFNMHDNRFSNCKAEYGGALYFGSGVPSLDNIEKYSNNIFSENTPSNLGSSVHEIQVTGESKFYRYPGQDIAIKGKLLDYWQQPIKSNHEAFDKIYVDSDPHQSWVHSNPIITQAEDGFEIVDLEIYGAISTIANMSLTSKWVSFKDNEYIANIAAPFDVVFLSCPAYSNTKQVPSHEHLTFCELDPIPSYIYVVGLVFGFIAIGISMVLFIFFSIKLTQLCRRSRFKTVYTQL